MRIWILANFDVQFYIIQRPWEARCIVWHYFCTNPCKSTILTICEMSSIESISHLFLFYMNSIYKVYIYSKNDYFATKLLEMLSFNIFVVKVQLCTIIYIYYENMSFLKIDKIQFLKFRADFRIIIIFKKSSAKYLS